MAVHPIDLYMEAVNSFREGDKDTATQKISQAIGSDIVTQPIKDSINKILTKGTYVHDIVLRLLEAEIKKR